ncbi:MAG: phosphatidylserine decarboxylase [Candidatus Thorarchaeota archaeon]
MRKLLLLIIVSFFILYLIGDFFGLVLYQIALLLWLPVLIILIGWFYWFRNIYFFRDPKREPPSAENIIVSPADGRIMYIYPVKNGSVVSSKNGEDIVIDEISKTSVKEKNGWLVGIYMSPFDVHYNYSPIDGLVKYIFHYQTGFNLPMVDFWEYINFTLLRKAVNLFSRKFHLVNERMTIEIVNESISCLLILIADKFVDKITKYFKEEDKLMLGQKISFIERGSQADLFIAKENLNFSAKVGQQVYGCKTVICTYVD